MKSVKVGIWVGTVETVESYMDDEIRERLHGTTEDAQEFVDEYCKAHAEKFGEQFVIN